MILKLALAIASFIPLYVLMIITYIHQYFYGDISKLDKRYIIITIIIILIVLTTASSLVYTYIYNKESTRLAEVEVIFTEIKEDKKAYVNYMFTYLLPLASLDLDKTSGFYILYINLLILLFVIMNARAENFNFNLILWSKNYYVYTGRNSFGEEKILLMKKKGYSNIRSNHEKFKFVSFDSSNSIYFCKKYIE